VLVFGNREISKVDGLKTQTSLSSFVDGTAGGATDFELRTHDECPADEKVTEFIASSESWYKNSISGQSYSFFQEVFATASEDSAKELASIFSEFTSFCDTETVSEGKYVLSKTTFGDFGTIRDVFGLDLEGVVLDFKHCDNMSTCWGDGQFADARVVLAYRGKVAMLSSQVRCHLTRLIDWHSVRSRILTDKANWRKSNSQLIMNTLAEPKGVAIFVF
jgi:hypothetical protein